MDEKNEKNVEREFDLRVIFGILKKNLVWIILVTFIFGIGSYFYSMFFIQKQYSASAVLIVNNKSTEKSTYNATEINAAQDLAEVYAIIIKSELVLGPVIEDLQLNMTTAQLSRCINISAVNKTQVMKITMTYPDAAFAQKVVAKVIEEAPSVIVDKVEAGSVKVISGSAIDNNGNPVSPNLKKNAIIGALIGLGFVLIVIFLKRLVNNKFLTEDDVINTLNVPVIGIIPEVDRKEFRKI